MAGHLHKNRNDQQTNTLKSVRGNYHFMDELIQDIIIGVCSRCAGIKGKKISNTNAFKSSSRSNTACSPQVVVVSIYSRRGDLQSAGAN